MNPPKPKKSLAGQKCPICHSGKFELVQIDHTEHVSEDNPIAIRGVWVDRCGNCDEIVFPGDTTHFIETVVAEQTEQLTPRELESVREDLGVETQDEMSEILGLGAKTYHKWESGAQYPTRSMSYYIRVLAQHPESFDWLRRRAWRDKNRLRQSHSITDWEAMFPDLPPPHISITRSSVSTISQIPRNKINPALGLARVAFVKI